jgi:hypothetical protein
MSKKMVDQQAIVPIMFRMSHGFEETYLEEKRCKMISIVKMQFAKVYKWREIAFETFI